FNYIFSVQYDMIRYLHWFQAAISSQIIYSHAFQLMTECLSCNSVCSTKHCIPRHMESPAHTAAFPLVSPRNGKPWRLAQARRDRVSHGNELTLPISRRSSQSQCN